MSYRSVNGLGYAQTLGAYPVAPVGAYGVATGYDSSEGGVGMDTTTMILIGGGVLALVGVGAVLYMSSK